MRKWMWIIAAMAGGIMAAQAEDAATTAPAAAVPTKLPAPDKADVALRLKSVRLLIESSSAAKQIEASGVQQALDDRAHARELHAQAAAALDAGDVPKAAQLLAEASKTMFHAVRLAAPDSITVDKKRGDFDQRLKSIAALEEALKRIASEKKAASDGAIASIDKLVAEAKGEEPSNIDGARTTLDKAYLTAKLAVEKLRDGDTLVRTLKFDSKADEYRYEVDRNDSHRMLVKMLLDEKRKVGSIDEMVAKSVDEAAQLRKNGEALAARGDYDAAIRMLEQSTSALVRAIRGAGIYIPG
ncbi:MAG TPA: hypothetical protein VF801_03025 [Rhodocyclaceae bacterium]